MGERDNEALNYFFFNAKSEKLLKKMKKAQEGSNLVFAAFPDASWQVDSSLRRH